MIMAICKFKYDCNESIIAREKPMVYYSFLTTTLRTIFIKESNMWFGWIAVKNDIGWCDEAYRSLSYVENESSSIWALNESDVRGISGRRISIESASKVWNACGLRIGGLLTDNYEFHQKAVSE